MFLRRATTKTESVTVSTASRGGCSWAPSTTTAKRSSTPSAAAGAAARVGCVARARPDGSHWRETPSGRSTGGSRSKPPYTRRKRALRVGGQRRHGRREERGDDPRGHKAQGRGGGAGARGRGRGGPGAAGVAAGGGGPLEASPRPGRVAHLAPAACRDPRGQPHGTRAHPHRRRAAGRGGLFLAPAREDPQAPRRRDT